MTPGQPQAAMNGLPLTASERLELAELRKDNDYLRKRFQFGTAWRPGLPLPPDSEFLRASLDTDYQASVAAKAREQQVTEDARLEREVKPAFEILTAAEVRALPPPEDIISGLIPATMPGGSCIGEMFGPSGTYKSFLMYHLAFCIRYSASFLGLPVTMTGSAVLVLGEGQGGAGKRMSAAIDAHPEFTDKCNCGSESCGHGIYVMREAFNLADPAAVAHFTARVQARKIPDLRLVWFDSLADFYGDEEENSASGMSRVLRGMRAASHGLTATVAGSGHTGHGSRDEDGNEKAPDRRRGSTRLPQSWDFQIQATGSELIARKDRDDELMRPVPYRLEKHLHSLAVADGAGSLAVSEPDAGDYWTMPPLGRTEARIWAAILEYLRDFGGDGKSFRKVDESVKGTTAVKQQMLNRMARLGVVADTGTEKHSNYTLKGTFTEWLEKYCAGAP